MSPMIFFISASQVHLSAKDMNIIVDDVVMMPKKQFVDQPATPTSIPVIDVVLPVPVLANALAELNTRQSSRTKK